MVLAALLEFLSARLIPVLSRVGIAIGERISAMGLRNILINLATALGLAKVDQFGKSRISGASILEGLSKNVMAFGGMLIFGAFILEEALQAVSMSIYIALRNDELKAAEKALEHYRNLLDIATEYVDSFVDPIPIIGDTFVQFVAASAIQAEVYARTIEKKKRGEPTKISPPKSGGIYAFTE